MNDTTGEGNSKRSRKVLIGIALIGLPIAGFFWGRIATCERSNAIDTRLPRVVAPQGDPFADKLLEKRYGIAQPEDKILEELENLNSTAEKIRTDAQTDARRRSWNWGH